MKNAPVKKLVFGACLGAVALACSPNHNEAERWAEAAYLPPPSGSLSCEEYAIHKAKFELLGGPGFWDFEGQAEATYTYTDRTAEIHISNDQLAEAAGTYETATLTDSTVCNGEGTGVLRLLSRQPFLNWGGGAGRRFSGASIRQDCPTPPRENDPPHCPKLNPLIPPEAGGSFFSNNYYLAIMDLSEWEGISFWARRGARAQPGIRVNFADIYVDDDISFLMSGYDMKPYCRRALSCDCSGDRRCVNVADEGNVKEEYCLTPAEEELYHERKQSGAEGVEPTITTPPEQQLRLDRCGQSKCEAMSQTFTMYGDPAFGVDLTHFPDSGNRRCQPYFFKSDVQSIYNTPDVNHCYDAENGPFPAENYEKCGDNWMASVYLTTEWKFYRVPFTAFQQQGWAMKSARLDVANLTMIRFTWGAGRVDHYLDNVRFYRRKR